VSSSRGKNETSYPLQASFRFGSSTTGKRDGSEKVQPNFRCFPILNLPRRNFLELDIAATVIAVVRTLLLLARLQLANQLLHELSQGGGFLQLTLCQRLQRPRE